MSRVKLGNQSMLYPYPSTILTTVVEGRRNFMQVGFVGIVNANPGMVAMGLGKHHLSIKALAEGAVIGLSVVSEPMMLKADYVGIRPGDKVDKSQVFKTFKGDHGADLLEEAPINLELKVLKVMDLGGLDVTVIAEIVEVYADEEVMTGKNPDITKINPLVFSMYENKYFTLGKNVGKGWSIGLTYDKLETFVKETIFKTFDKLEDVEFFRPFINDESTFVFDGITYIGFQGFSSWFKQIKENIEAEGIEHNVSQFDAKILEENRYEINFVVEFKATTKSGEKINNVIRETWILKESEGVFVFESYKTEAI